MSGAQRFRELLRADPEDRSQFIEPPFFRNHPALKNYPPEVTGYRLLDSMRRRLGWSAWEGRTLLDLGCGVRFTQTIVNLNIPIARYVGVDVYREAIVWLQNNVRDDRFAFAHFSARNVLYAPDGQETGVDALAELNLPTCEAACMFSVITHQTPAEAALTFAQLHRALGPGAQLYFTAFVSEQVDGYREGQPDNPGIQSTYNSDLLLAVVEDSGWRVDAVYAPSFFHQSALQQTAFVCQKR